jgi:hypothetical protein
MADWSLRLKQNLEPALAAQDPRTSISAYHDMPYAIFHYPPEDEFELRRQVTLLRTRLETNHGKRTTIISLAECLKKAIEAEIPVKELVEAEKTVGVAALIDTVHEILSRRSSLPHIVAKMIPPGGNPTKDIFFLVRAGSLFPFYRTSALLEQLMGLVKLPGILFYPGILDGASGLKFMGIKDAEHNYRPKIF